MKTFIIILLFLGLVTPSYSQIQKKTDKQEGKMDIINLPEIVFKKAGEDFSVYITDRNPDPNVRRLEEKFIAYDLGEDLEGNEEYLLTMEFNKGTLAATYNETGKLIRVVENYKNIILPHEVVYSIYKTFPDWRIINDKYLYTQEEGDIIKKQYNVRLKKNKDILKLTVRPDGEIVRIK